MANKSRGTFASEEDTAWRNWPDDGLPARSPVRWKLLIAGERTGTDALTLGVAELSPGASLLLHHHAPAEAYYILEGRGRVEVGADVREVGPGTAIHIPANARHRTTNTGPHPLRFLFVFPTDRFDTIEYVYDE